MRRYLVAGNWKMNGSRQANAVLLGKLAVGVAQTPGVEMLVCPPAVYLDSAGQALKGTPIKLGGQNLCDRDAPGAFPREVRAG